MALSCIVHVHVMIGLCMSHVYIMYCSCIVESLYMLSQMNFIFYILKVLNYIYKINI